MLTPRGDLCERGINAAVPTAENFFTQIKLWWCPAAEREPDIRGILWQITDARRDGAGGHLATSEERRALALLANDPNGATEAMLIAQGFSVSMLARLVVDRLVIARHEIGGRMMDIVRVRITNTGRAALKG